MDASEKEQTDEGTGTGDDTSGGEQKTTEDAKTSEGADEKQPPNYDEILAAVPKAELLKRVVSNPDDFVETEEFKRAVQSAKDREISRADTSRRNEERRTRDEERKRLDREERKALVDAQDYEALGKRAAADDAADETLAEAAKEYNTMVQDALVQVPEFKEMGAARLDEIRVSVQNRGGNVVDLVTEFSREYATFKTDQAVGKATRSVKEEFGTEMDALRTELGAKTRSRNVEDGELGSAAIAKSEGKNAPKDETYEAASTAYGDGEMSWEQFKPIRDEHEKERSL